MADSHNIDRRNDRTESRDGPRALKPRKAAVGRGPAGKARIEGEAATPQDQQWLDELIQRSPGSALLLRLASDDDVSGHMPVADPTVIRLVVQDEASDTEGHTISVRLPSVEEADALRRRLLLTGVLVGAVVFGGAGAALAISQSADASPGSGQSLDISFEDATPHRDSM